MKIHATGQLEHHFWGEYCCEIYLEFDSTLAALAIPRLTPSDLGATWKVSPSNPKWIGIHLSNEQLTRVTEVLVSLGADEEAITSLDHSVDHGDEFSIEVEVEDPRQVLMDWRFNYEKEEQPQ